MKDFFERLGINKDDIEKYKNNSEYMSDEFKEKYALIKSYLDCKKNGTFEVKRKEVLNRLYYTQGMQKIRLKASEYDDFFAAGHIQKIYNLNNVEWFILVIAIMYHADDKYKNAILKIEDTDKLTYNAILKLYFFTDDISKIDNYSYLLYSYSKKMNSLCFMDGIPKIDERLYENIMSDFDNEIRIPGLFFQSLDKSMPLLIREDIAVKISDFLSNTDSDTANCVCIHGEEGIGKKTIVKRVCALQNKNIMYIDLNLIDESVLAQTLLTGSREALLRKAYICFYNFKVNLKLNSSSSDSDDSLLKLSSAIDLAKRFSKVVFVISENKVNISQKSNDMDYISISLPELNTNESISIWKDSLQDIKLDKNLNLTEFASKFIFNPKQIKNAVYDALSQKNLNKKDVLDSLTLSESAYNQVTSDLSSKATLIRKKHSWDELVLNPKEKEVLKQACDQIRYRHIVYDKWGMNKRILYGKGLSMLFSGASGTGKTMAAQVIANELELEIYKVDLSKVISKYIGESEKNLGEIFDSAKKSNVILLFDETDAIFAKRTEVKDSHDRNANLETSYLLQKMEEHSGITIMTTNFLENIDKAFFRRINYVVHFTIPDINARKEIWTKMYPKEIPLAKDVDFNFLSQKFEITGGNIKNIALTSAFMAASENKKVGMKHIIKALSQEITKQGKMISKDDFGEYGYLL